MIHAAKMLVAAAVTAIMATAGLAPAQGALIRHPGIRGPVTALPDTANFVGDWTVDSRTVHVSEMTTIEDELCVVALGAIVDVRGRPATDGGINAEKIVVLGGPACGPGDGMPVAFRGPVDSLPRDGGLVGRWNVARKPVRVFTTTTLIQVVAPVTTGCLVEVRGLACRDGVVDAARIEVKAPPQPPPPPPPPGDGGTTAPRPVEFCGPVTALPAEGLLGEWTVGPKTVVVTTATLVDQSRGAVAVGANVKVRGVALTSTTLVAFRIEVLPKPAPRPVVLRGVVQEMPETGNVGTWKVADKVVNVSDQTRIIPGDATIAVGTEVTVVGMPQTDGSLDAIRVEVRRPRI